MEWIGREGLDTETHEEYLNNFIAHFYKNIIKLVDRAMRKYNFRSLSFSVIATFVFIIFKFECSQYVRYMYEICVNIDLND